MRRFACNGCGGALYFGNRLCLACGREAAYSPWHRAMVAVETGPDGMLSLATGDPPRPGDPPSPHPTDPPLPGPGDPPVPPQIDPPVAPVNDPPISDPIDPPVIDPQAAGAPGPASRFRHCANRFVGDACCWLVDAGDANAFCRSCRLSTMIPNLSNADDATRWRKVEAAKQWLLHSLLDLGIPFDRPYTGVRALEFHLLSSNATGEPITTGHLDGLITLDVAEADDAERARRRVALHEGYRTLLGHLRHEIGHYYWQVFARDPTFVDAFRRCFGDDRVDYAQALKRHYETGGPGQWQNEWISPYASSHPWEDWAETWAHYLHMADAVQTAQAHGLQLADAGDGGARAELLAWPPHGPALVTRWHAISLLLNDLNRAVGMPDAWPFAISARVNEKLAFVAARVRLASRLPDAAVLAPAGTAVLAGLGAGQPARRPRQPAALS